MQLRSGLTLNATGSNSSITFVGLNLTCDAVRVFPIEINLVNCSYASAGTVVNISPAVVNWTQRNTWIDASEFVSPIVAISSPVDGLITNDPNVLFNTSVIGITRVSSRFYSLDHGINNVTFSGQAIVNSPPASYHVFLCAEGLVGNRNCTSEIGYTVNGPDSLSPITGGVTNGGNNEAPRLAGINVSYQELWLYGVSYAIRVEALDQFGTLVAADNVNISLIKGIGNASALTILKPGLYEQEFSLEHNDANEAFFFVNVTRDGVTKTFTFRIALEQGSTVESALQTAKNKIALEATRLLSTDRGFVTLLAIAVLLLFLAYLIYATARKKGIQMRQLVVQNKLFLALCIMGGIVLAVVCGAYLTSDSGTVTQAIQLLNTDQAFVTWLAIGVLVLFLAWVGYGLRGKWMAARVGNRRQ